MKNSNYLKFYDMDMPRITKEIDANDAGLMWIHVHEPSALKDLAVKLAMHELCAAGF